MDTKIWGKYSFLWGIHFLFHIVVGLFVLSMGILVFYNGNYLSGLALIGAAAFALSNGISNFCAVKKTLK